MGCLTAIFKLMYDLMSIAVMAFLYITSYLFIIIKFIVEKIISIVKNKKSNTSNIYTQVQFQKSNTDTKKSNIKQETQNKKNITNSYAYLKIYISKKHTGLIKNNELNYKMLGIESYDAPIVYYDDYAEVKGYNVFEAEECSSEKYGNLLNKIYILYGNDFNATIGYEDNKIEYTITVKDNKIYINGNNIETMKNRYMYLKNKIISFSDKLPEYFIYIEDNDFYYNVVPNDDLDCDSISSLSDKLKENDEILMFETPYMEEISAIIDIIEPKIIREYQKEQVRIFNNLPEIETIENEEYIFDFNTNNNNEKEMSWKEKEFEKEADLWGLSKEDRRIAKEERMSPAEFVEAEEHNDDELFLDEWER